MSEKTHFFKGTMLAFDTHQYVKKLVSAGMPEPLAEIQSEALSTIIEQDLVTKQDLELAKAELKRDIKDLEASTRRDIKELDAKIELTKSELKRDLAEVKADLLKWIVGLMLAQTGVIAALVKLL